MITPIPYLHSTSAALWSHATEHWQFVKTQLDPVADELTAIFLNPFYKVLVE